MSLMHMNAYARVLLCTKNSTAADQQYITSSSLIVWKMTVTGIDLVN